MTEAELVARLEKLERDNRRLKRIGAGVLVLAAAVGMIAATRPVPQKITAHEFDVVDGRGTVRIKLSVYRANNNSGAQVALFDADGRLSSNLSEFAGAATMDFGPLQPLGGGSRSAALTPRLSLGVVSGVPHLLMLRANGDIGAGINVSPNGPTVSLSDGRGYSTVIGTTGLITPTTGETHQTSAASIVMFGNGEKHHVIWQAP